MNKTVVNLLVAVFFTLIAVQVILSMRQKSATFDEGAHLSAGYSYLKTGDFRLNKEHPPLIKMLASIPLFFLNLDFPYEKHSWIRGNEWEFSDLFIYHNRTSAEKILFLGRIPILILSLILGFFVFQWSKELYGLKSGLFALFLYTFS
ncbi:hypothetical protein N9A72_00150, partial [bacterium]|nr:hypothetical protein [bacterium]